jgi:hypothetical protein
MLAPGTPQYLLANEPLELSVITIVETAFPVTAVFVGKPVEVSAVHPGYPYPLLCVLNPTRVFAFSPAISKRIYSSRVAFVLIVAASYPAYVVPAGLRPNP